jgi:GDPmannose 4,6-dehydratase
MTRRALICGISGQDGAYLAQLLLSKGYEVWGTSRDGQINTFHGLKTLGIFDRVNLRSMSPEDFRSVLQVFSDVKPHEIYNLAGQSSVGLSFEQPLETMASIATGTLNQLEAIRFVDKSMRFYNAGSSEVFGDIGDKPAVENTPFRPRSPYAVAKAAATWQVSVYREAYDLFACTGILFNHESPLRPDRFVTKKIVAAAYRIAHGSKEKLNLGNIEVYRDWGWAPDYVDAMWRMLDHSIPEDFVIATGVTQSLKDFIAATFEEASLEWENHVNLDPDLRRPSDLSISAANPAKAEQFLSWKASCAGPEIARKMYRSMKSGSAI